MILPSLVELICKSIQAQSFFFGVRACVCGGCYFGLFLFSVSPYTRFGRVLPRDVTTPPRHPTQSYTATAASLGMVKLLSPEHRRTDTAAVGAQGLGRGVLWGGSRRCG